MRIKYGSIHTLEMSQVRDINWIVSLRHTSLILKPSFLIALRTLRTLPAPTQLMKQQSLEHYQFLSK
jgi:hypothetical protein